MPFPAGMIDPARLCILKARASFNVPTGEHMGEPKMAACNPNHAKGSIFALTIPLGRATHGHGMLLGPRKEPGSESAWMLRLCTPVTPLPALGGCSGLGQPSPPCIALGLAASRHFMRIKCFACGLWLSNTSGILPFGSETITRSFLAEVTRWVIGAKQHPNLQRFSFISCH